MKTSTYAVITACLALAATGCGSTGKSDDPANPPGVTGAQGDGSGGPGQGLAGGPGGSGKVAAVSGSTAQVQSQGGQVAVTWTAKTTFTQEVATKASALGVGDCVMVLPARSTAPGSDDNPDVSSGGATDGPVAAATVRIVAPVGGSCSPVSRVGGGPRAGTAPMRAPGAATGAPDQDQKAGDPRPFMSGAFGKVSAVTGSGFTVESAAPSGSSATPAPTSTPVSTQVTTSADTVWTASRKATAKAVAVGRCVTSMGRADSTGAIAAASITVSSPVSGECAVGFGGPQMSGPGGQGPAPDNALEQSP